MALVKTSSDIVSIRGRFGGVYFKKGSDGLHVQPMPRTVKYARSDAQMGSWGEGSPFGSSGITGFSGAGFLWLLALLSFFGAAWAAYALAFLFTTHTGEKKGITGYNWYIHYALIFPETERPPYWEPPHSPSDLPNFLVTYKGFWTYYHEPSEWPVDVPSGTYYEGLVYNGKQSYRTDNLNWYLWWKDPVWVLSIGLAFEDPATTFYSPDGRIDQLYKNPVTGKYASVFFGNPDEVHLPH